MKLLLQQLGKYLPKSYTADELVTAIEKSGIELEGLQSSEPLNTKVVVGLTKKVVQHPNADKLKLVLVDVGTGTNLHIVCGAPNVDEDMLVAVATVGTILPDATEIKEAKLRGELSQGMLCSEAELGWSNSHEGIVELPQDYQVGKSLCDIVENSVVAHVKSAANRSDLQSYEGIAREVAAQLGVAPILPNPKISPTANPKLIKKSDKQALAFGAVHMDVRHVGATPLEVVRVLAASGIRQISPVVDITNYVSLVVGQPTHAFDASKLKLPLSIRFATKGESVKTLNGKNNTLTVDDLVVADATGPIDIAGVMGGAETEVGETTQEIVLISSILEAMTVRKTAQRHGIRTDASARIERRLPVELGDRGRAMVVEMLVDMGAKVISGARQGAVESPKRVIEVKPERINSLLGIEVPPKEMIKHLQSLGFTVTGLAKLKITVPWWRPDVQVAADITEEIIKMVGLDALPATIPAWSPENIQFDTKRALTDKVRELLRAAGLFELTTYSFISEQDLQRFGLSPAKHLKLKNPLSIEQAYMRSSLLPSLVKVMEFNQRYAANFGVSEISRVFVPQGKKGALPKELYKVGVAVMGDYYAAKAALDLLARDLRLDLQFKPSKSAEYYPGRQASIYLNGEIIGSIGELHPNLTKNLKGNRSLSFAELELEPIIEAAGAHIFEPISRFPSISRDIAVVVKKSVLWAQLATAIQEHNPTVKLSFQSRYEGKGIPDGQVSLAFRITMSDTQRTLTDAEADEVVEQIMTQLKKDFAATPRS